jgi:hypothetical protein
MPPERCPVSGWRVFLGTRWGGVVWWVGGALLVLAVTLLLERAGWRR